MTIVISILLMCGFYMFMGVSGVGIAYIISFLLAWATRES